MGQRVRVAQDGRAGPGRLAGVYGYVEKQRRCNRCRVDAHSIEGFFAMQEALMLAGCGLLDGD